MGIGEIFHIILLKPIITILVGIYQLLVSFHIPSPLGFSIILLTVVIRFIIYPLISSQIKIQKKTQALTPHLSKIKDKHKGDAKKIQEETMRLYKEHGLNPAAGCLPTLIQLPIIWALYTVLHEIVQLKGKAGLEKLNSDVLVDSWKLQNLWDPHFFGISLAQTPAQLIQHGMIFIALIPVLTAVLQFIQSKMMFTKPVQPEEKKLKDPKEKKGQEDFAMAFQTQSMYLFPIMIGFFSYTLPFGLSLYWNTFTVFGILQQYRVGGLGGLTEWIQKIKK